MTIKCCRDCKQRRVGCHADCTLYKKELHDYRTERNALHQYYTTIRSYRTIALAQKGVIFTHGYGCH